MAADEVKAFWAAIPSAERPKEGEAVEITNSVGMKLVVIPPGEYMMGNESRREGTVKVPVTLTKPFLFGAHEVTQGQ